MRALMAFVAGLATAAILVMLGILVAQNQQGEQLAFLGATVAGTAGLDVAAGAALGFVAALFLLLPGQVAGAVRNKALEGHGAKLRGQLETLRLEHTRLKEDYRCVQDEAGRLRSAVAQLIGSSAAAAIAAPPGKPTNGAKENNEAKIADAKKAPEPQSGGVGERWQA